MKGDVTMNMKLLIPVYILSLPVYVLAGPGSEGAAPAKIPVNKVDCTSMDTTVAGLMAPYIEESAPVAPPSLIVSAMPVVTLPSMQITPASLPHTSYTYSLPFNPIVHNDWNLNLGLIIGQQSKMTGTVYDVFAASQDSVQFLTTNPEAITTGLALHAYIQTDPYVQNANACIQKLVMANADIKTRITALVLQSSVHLRACQRVLQNSMPLVAGMTITEMVQNNKDGKFDPRLLQASVYACLATMADQLKIDPVGYIAYQQTLKTILGQYI
jgi:hypothetical protein